MMTSQERGQLLQIARDAITAHVTGGVRAVADPAGLAARRGGVFVSLHRHGELRGCIGHIEQDSLTRVVAQCAVAACSADPRFSAVTPVELHEIAIELSLLGPLEPAAGPADVEVGRHGLLVEMGRQRGLLLPQVATEWQWDAATFLAQTCRKAGLPEDSWKRAGVKVWRFEAEVFAESEERKT
jgi:AmmeMemoRadiSam system protein A